MIEGKLVDKSCRRKISRSALAFSALSESRKSGSGKRVAAGAFGSFFCFLKEARSLLIFFFLGLSPDFSSSSSSSSSKPKPVKSGSFNKP